MAKYEAYGLLIDSDFDLPFFQASDSATASTVAVRRLPDLGRGTLRTTYGNHRSDRSIVQFARTCRLEILGGREVRIAGEVGIGEEELATYVTGVGIGVLQHQLGRLVLHASAVKGPAGGVAFLGEPKQGKSSTAAALYFSGWPLLTDDVAAFVPHPLGRMALVPAFPFMKLWPGSLRAVGRDASDYPPIYPGAEKRRVSAHEGFGVEVEELTTIYVLDEGPRVEVADIGGHVAFSELVRHSFAVRVLEDSGPPAWHAQLAARLVRETRIRRLVFPRQVAHGMEPIVRAICDDLSRSS